MALENFLISRGYIDRIDLIDLAVLDRHRARAHVEIGRLARDLGLQVRAAPMSPNISGLIKPEGKTFVIKVNKFDSRERQRFTVAHEVSHYLLHRNSIRNGVVDSVMYRSLLTSRKEVEANQLAAELLMPYTLMLNEMKLVEWRIDEVLVSELAKKFFVSFQAMSIRLGMG